MWGSWTKQDIRLIRSAGNILDRTILKTYNIKGNWQASKNDMISVLWFNGEKQKFGRATGDAQVLAPTATWNQGNRYPENRPHGLLKFENNHAFSPGLFLSTKYAYYGTGFSLEPAGGLTDLASVSTRLGEAFGTTRALRFLRPQNILNLDANHFRTALGGSHDIKFGMGWRRHDATSQTLWPGNMIQARDNSDTDKVARVYREGLGTNRTDYLSFYAGDTFSRGRLTIDAGLRFDRQTGSALPSTTLSNPAFPSLVPGIEFSGYDAPFSWNTLHPRLGATWALDSTGRRSCAGTSAASPDNSTPASPVSAIPARTPATSTIAGTASTPTTSRKPRRCGWISGSSRPATASILRTRPRLSRPTPSIPISRPR